MKLPILTELQSSKEMIDVFKGYNHNLRISEGEFYDMKNLTSSYYPLLSPRQKRGRIKLAENVQGFIKKDSLCYVDGQYFVVDEDRVDMGLSTLEEDCPKTLILMGAYVIVMPDKKYINTIKNGEQYEWGEIEASVEVNASFTMCNLQGEDYPESIPTTKPDNPQNLDYWIDTTDKPHVLRQWSESQKEWVSIPTTYIKITANNIGDKFAVNDGITISTNELADINNTIQIVWDKSENYIVISGFLDEITSGKIKIERKMPKIDFIFESGNRLWGCRYGEANNGEIVNEIYASKLGDFKNWNCFMGISTDSYTATVGSVGQFTGGISHMGYPLFFKEDYLHKVYGDYPSNYQIVTSPCRGVQKGSHKSLAIVNEVLYYKARNGICAFDGSLPQEVSYQLGNVPYSEAVAGSHGNKYYVSMHNDSTNKWELLVYDTIYQMWHKDDDIQVYEFCSSNNELYFVERDQNFIIKTMFGSGIIESEKVKWMAESGLFGIGYVGNKYISKLNVRMSLELNSRVEFFIQYNSNPNWEYLFRMDGTSLQSFTVPIKPRRCDHFKIRIEGEGEAKIYSIVKTITAGSDK